MELQENKNAESSDPPFPSPTHSEGPPVPPHRPALPSTISQFARSGLPGFNGALPIGFPTGFNMCYRNAALSLLMNVTPFVGYLDHFPIRTRNTGTNVLFELGDMAAAYWSIGSDKKRRQRLGDIIDKLWAHLLYLNYDDLDTVGWGPFLDSEQLELQQDAGDFLENLLVNGDAECLYRPNDRIEYNTLVESTFEIRTTCAGNCNDMKKRREQLDRTRLWSVNIDHSKGATGGTLEDAIRTTLTNEIDLTCEKCKKLDKEGKSGRIWLRMRDAPELLFIRIARFKRTKRGTSYRKCSNEVTVPEILDMTPHLEEADKQTGVEARYRLCGSINHAGTMNSGHFVAHVRGPNRQWHRLDDETVSPSSLTLLTHNPARFRKTHKFTPYILAYTKIYDGDDLTPDRASPTPPPPSPAAESTDVRFRVKIDAAGQTFTMTRKLKGFATLDNQALSMAMDVVDRDGNRVLRVEPIMFQLVAEAVE